MIWESQFDAMMMWLASYELEVSLQMEGKNTTGTTGYASTDVLNNIYDLLGSRREFTQEGYKNTLNNARVLRGGGLKKDWAPTSRSYCEASGKGTDLGSRVSLYIK